MKRVFLVMLLAGGLVGSVQAGSGNQPSFIPIVNYLVQDTSRWEIYQDFGRFVRWLPGSQCGAFWPKGTGRNYIFGAGLWVGALDTTDRDTAVVRGYDLGPGGTAWGPCLPNGDTTGAMTDSLARIYRSDIPRDTAQWPERDSLGRAIYYSDQELWAIASGLNPLNPNGPVRIGVVALRRSLAWNSPGPWGDITRMEFEVKNVTGRYQPPARTLRKVIVGWGVDADIGNESGTNANDMCRLERTTGSPYPNLAVQYQFVQEGGWGPPGPPYQVGLRFVEGPVNNTGDTVRVRSQPGIGYPQYDHDILPGQPLGLTAFQLFTLDGPTFPGECYLTLSGRYYGTPQILNSYRYDIFGPDDKRFVLACGPFDLPNDSVARFVIHIIGASDSLDLIRKAELLGVESPTGPVPRNASGLVLYPCFPNPAHGSCLIRYSLFEPSSVTLRIYDVCGRLVKELDRGDKPAGSHEARWSGRDEVGRAVPGGVYFYRLVTTAFSQTRSVILIH